MSLNGKIFKGIGGFYYLHTAEGDFACKAKGVFRNKGVKPLVGDDAVLEVLDAETREGSITEILPRRNRLIRPEVANVDQAVVVFALTNPAPNLNLLDRFLISMEQQDIPVVILFNKRDLACALSEKEAKAQTCAAEAEACAQMDGCAGLSERFARIPEIYRAAGYEVHVLSAREEHCREKLMEVLRGKTSVLAGPSGVGKSTITNLLHPQAEMETGELSKKIARGKHTTRHSEFFCLEDETYVLDTPGFTSLYVTGIESERLMYYYREFEQYRTNCRFNTCVHVGERDCGVKQALSEGVLAKERYESYLQIYEELKSSRRY